jgi:hypothetical protein
MKRLNKEGNHVGPAIREDIIKDILDGERIKKRNSSDSYLIAKQLIMDSILTPTNENILTVAQDIDAGKYSDLGKSKDNWDKWVDRTHDIFRDKKILLANKGENKMKRLKRKADAIMLDSSIAINAQDALAKIQAMNGKLTNENLLSDTGANRSAICGYVDDTGEYVLEVYSYKDDLNAVVVAKINNGVLDTNYDIQVKNGTRTDVKNTILSNGYTLQNGVKLTFGKKYTSVPPKEEEQEVAVDTTTK